MTISPSAECRREFSVHSAAVAGVASCAAVAAAAAAAYDR